MSSSGLFGCGVGRVIIIKGVLLSVDVWSVSRWCLTASFVPCGGV